MSTDDKTLNPLNAKDLAFFDLMVKRGSNLQKSAKKIVSFRTTERFRWALEIYKRYLGGNRQDSEVLEYCLWEALVRENPGYAAPQRSTLERQNQLTKFFLVNADKDDEGNIASADYKYSSVVELTWNEFEIFRIIKLYVIEPGFLDIFEREIISFILKRKEFWIDRQNSLEDGFLSGHAVAETFEDPFNLERETADKWMTPLQNLREDFNNGNLNLENLLIKETDDLINSREIMIIEEDRFAEEFSFGHETGKVEKRMVIDHFSIEVQRLLKLVPKVVKAEWTN